MTPADRAALAARLRAEGNGLMFDARWSESNGIDAPNERRLGGGLLAAAAELERPRPRVEWRRHATYEDEVRAVIATRSGYFPVSLWWGDTHAEIERTRLLAAGFDVDPPPEVPDAR